MQTRPYPFDRWPKTTRAQLRAGNVVRSLYDASQCEAALRCASGLLAAPVSVVSRAPEAWATSDAIARLSALGPFVAFVLECPATDRDSCVVLEVSGPLAERLVDRALGGEAPALSPTLLPADDLSRGTLAYLAARCLAALGGRLRLRDVSVDAAAVATALAETRCMIQPFEVQLGTDVGSARLYVPEMFALPLTAREPQLLPDLPLTLVAELGRATLRSAELSGLHRGDIVVLDGCALRTEAERWIGQVAVHVLGSATHLVCQAVDHSLQVERLTSVTEPAMTTGRLSQPPTTPSAQPELAADAPLEVHVELARFSLTLGELQRMRAGDVLSTGRRIGENVTLRVGGRAIAQGELLDVEGEIGVRITQFLVAGT